VHKQISYVIFGLLLLGLTACQQLDPAPVYEGVRADVPESAIHHVLQGETLYSIAWRYDTDYRRLAKINKIPAPYHIYRGQRLQLKTLPQPLKTSNKTLLRRLHAQASKLVKNKSKNQLSKRTNRPKLLSKAKQSAVRRVAAARSITHWRWPTKGRVMARFSRANKGIDIIGRLKQAVRATAAGVVAYSGDGLRGYGKLIIIKHNDEYLSAYAHNRKILVKEGQKVKAGQKIAEMGSSGTNRVKLHFEIRRAGKPVNPLRYLA